VTGSAGRSGPVQVVVMGVSGTGKSAVGAGLAEGLGLPLVEGDEHHPPSNIEKMSSGEPLTDEDRRPWLEALAEILADATAGGRQIVLACSALRRSYRDILRAGAPPGSVCFVHLHGDFAVIEERVRDREHFMPPTLLRSQFDTLEPLEDDEVGFEVDVAPPLAEVVAAALDGLRSPLGCRPSDVDGASRA
jgi:gluconokinase